MPHPDVRATGGMAMMAALLVSHALLPAHALAAGPYDGVYQGTQRETLSNNSGDCLNLNNDKVVLTIEDNRFTRTWRVKLEVTVQPDGSFSASAVSGGRGFRTAEIKGKITNGNLEADIGTNLCSAHLSLKKS